MADSHPWQERIDRRLSDLNSLEPGWLDGHGRAITSAAIEGARNLLCSLAVASLAIPEVTAPGGIVPTEDGGVSLEWHVKGGAWLSIEITANGRIEAQSTAADGQQEAQFGYLDEDTMATGSNHSAVPDA